MPLSPKFPLQFTVPAGSATQTTQGYESLESTSLKDQSELVRFHIKNILLTCPGENIGNLQMGCCLKQFLFSLETGGPEYNDLGLFDNIITSIDGATPQEKISNLIREQLGTYAPYVNITNVNVLFVENTMSIQISYFVNFTGANSISDVFDIALDQLGGFSSNNQINSSNASFDEFGESNGQMVDFPSDSTNN